MQRAEIYNWITNVLWMGCKYYSARKVCNFFLFLQKPGGFQWSASAWGSLEPSYACVNAAGHLIKWLITNYNQYYWKLKSINEIKNVSCVTTESTHLSFNSSWCYMQNSIPCLHTQNYYPAKCTHVYPCLILELDSSLPQHLQPLCSHHIGLQLTTAPTFTEMSR